MELFKLTKAQLKLLVASAHKDETKTHLSCVWVSDTKALASDGHILAIATGNGYKLKGKDKYVHRIPLKLAKTALAAMGDGRLSVSIADDGGISLSVDFGMFSALFCTVKLPAVTPLEYRAAFPNTFDVSTGKAFAISGRYLAMASLVESAAGKGCGGIAVYQRAEEPSAKLLLAEGESRAALLVMPIGADLYNLVEL